MTFTDSRKTTATEVKSCDFADYTMKNWQVTYTDSKGKQVIKYYASMATATQAVAKLAINNITANYSPVYSGGMDI